MFAKLAILILIKSGAALAGQVQVIDTLGSSPKGQYVALEEYGYRQEKHVYYVVVKVMNMWKEEYVGKPLLIEVPAHRPGDLENARKRAKNLAQEILQKYHIIPG